MSAVEAEHSLGVTEEPNPSPWPVEKRLGESRKTSTTKTDDPCGILTVHEQKYQDIAKALEREEARLTERQKKLGGNSAKLKRHIQETFDLNAMKQFNDLQIEYQRKKAKNPTLKLRPSLDASTTIARRFGKSDYYAKRLRGKLSHLHQVGELQVSRQGKGAAHQSLLSQPQVVAAIQGWVKGTVAPEKGGYIGRV